MTAVTADNRKIFQMTASAFGGDPKVFAYYDDKKVLEIDLISCTDRPEFGINSYGTLGLSDYPLMQNDKAFATRVEFVGACHAEYEWFPRVLSTAAFFVMRDGWFPCPGAVFETLVGMYDDSLEMKHILFHSPFLWDSLRTTKLDAKTVSWLLCVPISDVERRYAKERGWEALDRLFEKKQIDIFDLQRASVI